MKIGIMQPYFMPYIGYFQLINSVDAFVIYDNIQYTKKGWINRNRYLLNGKDVIFTIPIKKDSDYLNVNQRVLADGFSPIKLLNQIKAAYRKAPYYSEVYPMIEEIFKCEEKNLFNYIYKSIIIITEYLNINTKIIISSSLNIDHSLKGQDKVLAICKCLKTKNYINSIGGTELYSKSIFDENNIKLNFIKSQAIEYKQFNHDFVPWLSILDVMMFNEVEDIKKFLECYEVI